MNPEELILMNWIWIMWTKVWDYDEYFKWTEYESSELKLWFDDPKIWTLWARLAWTKNLNPDEHILMN